jgi:hypothetical protein
MNFVAKKLFVFPLGYYFKYGRGAIGSIWWKEQSGFSCRDFDKKKFSFGGSSEGTRKKWAKLKPDSITSL